jgi:hypothetical protein
MGSYTAHLKQKKKPRNILSLNLGRIKMKQWNKDGTIFRDGETVLAFIYNDINAFRVVVNGQLFGTFRTKKRAQKEVEVEFEFGVAKPHQNRNVC